MLCCIAQTNHLTSVDDNAEEQIWRKREQPLTARGGPLTLLGWMLGWMLGRIVAYLILGMRDLATYFCFLLLL